MMGAVAVRLLVVLVVGLLIFTPIATQAFLWFADLRGVFALPLYQFWSYLLFGSDDPAANPAVVASDLKWSAIGAGFIALPFIVLTAALLFRNMPDHLPGPRLSYRGPIQDPIPSTNRTHGDANSMSLTQARKIFDGRAR